ncbi:MAG: alpha/beta fold hydrolase [Bacteroidota bacterium]
MKPSLILILLSIYIYTTTMGQELSILPYEFVSKAKDTVQAELGTFYVLEDRRGKKADSIQLSFIRFKSTNPSPGSPIIYLAGGPGGSGIGTAKGNRFTLFMKLREVADVIAFDQRGTGRSEALPDCPYRANFELGRAISKEEYIQKTSENIDKCLSYWESENVNLAAYNTTESAQDLDDLRKVLGVEKISFWGISYGSHLAFEYIRLFEERIDKVVLASLEGSDETIKLPQDTEDFLFHVAELAKENYGSKFTYPDLKEKILAVHERVRKKAVTGSYVNRQGGIDTVGISNFELQSAIATFYLKNPENSNKLPKLYTQMYNGDFSGIAADVMVMKRYVLNSVRAMPFAMDMQSGISQGRAKLVQEQIDKAVLGSTINFLLFEWMTNTDFPQLPDSFRGMKTNKVDALLFSGSLDGRTYLQDGINIAQRFKNGQHIIVENAGHDLYMTSPLIGSMMVDFFNGKKLGTEKVILDPVEFD